MSVFRVLLLVLLIPLAAVAADLPDDSIYQIDSSWADQNNKPVPIGALQGKVQVVAFVYTYCEHSCPTIIANLKRLDSQLSQQLRGDTQFALVSLDPVRDTPEVLKAFMDKHQLDQAYWRMLHGDPDDVLELAALIGVRYKPMDMEGKDIAHSNTITVLDRQGRIHYQMKGLSGDMGRVSAELSDAWAIE